MINGMTEKEKHYWAALAVAHHSTTLLRKASNAMLQAERVRHTEDAIRAAEMLVAELREYLVEVCR